MKGRSMRQPSRCRLVKTSPLSYLQRNSNSTLSSLQSKNHLMVRSRFQLSVHRFDKSRVIVGYLDRNCQMEWREKPLPVRATMLNCDVKT